MNENYSKYQDFTNRLCSIQLSTRRKSLKKPNLEEILRKLKSLLRSMEESGANNEQKVMCHKEIALIYLNLGNQFESNDHWINAGRIYFDMAFDRKEINCPAEIEFQLLMEQCYLNVANQFINQNNLKFANFTNRLCSIQLSTRRKSLKKPNLEEILRKLKKSGANNEQKVMCHKEIALIYLNLGNQFESNDHWINAGRIYFDMAFDRKEINCPAENEFKLLMEQCYLNVANQFINQNNLKFAKLRIILLIFISSKFTDLQQQFLSQYQNNNWKNIYLKTSWANKQDFELICEFIKAINKEDYLKSIQIQQLNFDQILDEKGYFLSCPLIETNLEFDILGSGFHRQIFISSHLSSKNRLIGCVLSYRFEIPSGAYLNLRSLKHHFNQRNISSTKHCIFSSFDFDVEKPYNLNNESQYSSSTIIFINSNKFPTKSFLLNDYFYLPVRIRYHSPDPKGINLNSDIKFKSPNVFLHCTENNETLLNDINCKRLIQQVNTNT
uniref:Phosphatidylinositol-glycan biosynthesis class X protein n=1 Tax=Meloidogyne floridensis TaxID=298350 RepID=A0A915P1I0_9BILA